METFRIKLPQIHEINESIIRLDESGLTVCIEKFKATSGMIEIYIRKVCVRSTYLAFTTHSVIYLCIIQIKFFCETLLNCSDNSSLKFLRMNVSSLFLNFTYVF